MKKTFAIMLILMLIISMLTACGGGNSNSGGGNNTTNNNTPATASNSGGNTNESGNSSQSIKEVIYASQLISKEDVESLMDKEATENKIGEMAKTLLHFRDKVSYSVEGYYVDAELWQEALHNKDDDFENDLLKNGWTKYLQAMENGYSKSNEKATIIQKEGKLGTYYIIDTSAMQVLNIFYKDYCISLTLMNPPFGSAGEDNENEREWKREKLIEFADLAGERLSDIID